MRFRIALFFSLQLSILPALGADVIKVHPEIPATADRVTIDLTVNRPGNPIPGNQNQQVQSQDVPEGDYREYGDKRFDIFMNLGKMVDGQNYFLMARSAEELKMLHRHGNELLQVVVLRESEPGKKGMEKIIEGYNSTGYSIEVPLKLEFPPLGKNGLTEGIANLQLNMNRNGQDWNGNVGSIIQLQAEGSRALSNSRLVVEMSPLAATTPTMQQQIRVRMEPFVESLPVRSAGGKLDDALTLGNGKVMVESIASDLSSITLAVMNGTWADLEKYEEKKLENLPKFAQVELFERKVYTNSELLALSKSGHTVLVFGDFQQEMPPGYAMPMPGRGSSSLGMSEDSIVELLGREMEVPPSIVFVVRQISTKMLYDTYIMRKPGFLALSDFDDPLRVSLRTTSSHYYGEMHPGQTSPSLRDRLGLAGGKVSLVLVDKSGKVLNVKPDAGAYVRGALLEINEAMRELDTGKPADAATTTTAGGHH